MTDINIAQAVLSHVDEDVALEFIEYREKIIEFPLTQNAFNRSMRTAFRCQDLGITPTQAVEITMDKGWRAVTYEYVARELASRRQALQQSELKNSNTSTRERKVDIMLEDRSWAKH